MHRMIAVALGLALTAVIGPAPRASERALANAEREFAAAGLRDGVQKSFLAHFADDAVVLRPFVTPARAWYAAHADRPARLIWGPQYVAVSAAGDLGMSSGPWRLEGERDGSAQVAHGHFFSIWRHDAVRGWQVVFDHGIGHPASSPSVEDTPLDVLDRPDEHASGRIDARRKLLAQTDDELRERLVSAAADAYGPVAQRNTLWLRDGLAPVRAQSPGTPGAKSPCGCGPRVRLELAASGDFGYTIGGDAAARERGADIRVWRFRRGRGWTLLADLVVAAD